MLMCYCNKACNVMKTTFVWLCSAQKRLIYKGETRFIVFFFYRISGYNVITIEADRHTRHSDKCLSSPPTVLRVPADVEYRNDQHDPATFWARSDFSRDKLIGHNLKWTSIGHYHYVSTRNNFVTRLSLA